MKPDLEKGIKCYVDVNFAGGRNQEKGKEPGLVLSRTGYAITYDNFPIIWESWLQIEIAPSTTEEEHISLSKDMGDDYLQSVLLRIPSLY